jgi:ribonuclease HI
VTLFLFTDGACRRSGLGGWACVAVSNGQEVWRISGSADDTTNNAMELMAILRGLAKAATYSDNVIVTTDSKYAIAVATRPDKANPFPLPKNIVLIRQIRSLAKPPRVKFEWVKGHSGHKWNELADKLATTARDALALA